MATGIRSGAAAQELSSTAQMRAMLDREVLDRYSLLFPLFITTTSRLVSYVESMPVKVQAL
jgi:delta-aminolevulinic acid dehydratase/porphobilinogen synthase